MLLCVHVRLIFLAGFELSRVPFWLNSSELSSHHEPATSRLFKLLVTFQMLGNMILVFTSTLCLHIMQVFIFHRKIRFCGKIVEKRWSTKRLFWYRRRANSTRRAKFTRQERRLMSSVKHWTNQWNALSLCPPLHREVIFFHNYLWFRWYNYVAQVFILCTVFSVN